MVTPRDNIGQSGQSLVTWVLQRHLSENNRKLTLQFHS